MAPQGTKRQFSSSSKKAGLPVKRRKFKRQTDYHSSSDESDQEITVIPSGANAVQAQPTIQAGDDEDGTDDEVIEEDDDEVQMADTTSEDEFASGDSESDSEDEQQVTGPRKKRNDPTAFATSMSKILNSKLTTAKRADPVLSRSKDASAAAKELGDSRLEAKAKQKLRDEKRAKLDNGRVKDVMGLDSTNISTEDILAREKRLKKLAQKGVIRLFNAVLAAQLKGQEAAHGSSREGVVGIDKREQKVNEMSKQGFLDLIASGGKK
ncbi:Rrp15p-domain-containing protein [Microthyrium microscopicum]|uniref:Rrp15p-domain-containing protein n=1 Tax=Microthyrium microscopicum TaxID=703497 RepID=A0A6A6ULB5_9PEZI|nr:Rrp15p-domain-containing protein [Microthyrium microscopicum]